MKWSEVKRKLELDAGAEFLGDGENVLEFAHAGVAPTCNRWNNPSQNYVDQYRCGVILDVFTSIGKTVLKDRNSHV